MQFSYVCHQQPRFFSEDLEDLSHKIFVTIHELEEKIKELNELKIKITKKIFLETTFEA